MRTVIRVTPLKIGDGYYGSQVRTPAALELPANLSGSARLSQYLGETNKSWLLTILPATSDVDMHRLEQQLRRIKWLAQVSCRPTKVEPRKGNRGMTFYIPKRHAQGMFAGQRSAEVTESSGIYLLLWPK